MTASLIDADSVLVIDVGTVSTRAILFDDVDGRYRYIASGSAPSTAVAPFRNVSEGVRVAIDQLQNLTGRILVGIDEELIMPRSPDGSGVDKFVATISAGSPLKVVAVGLLEDISLESARHLATTTYAKVMETISLNDRRRSDQRIDAILKLRPNLIIVAGGTEDGASQSVLRLLESVGLACYMIPEEQRPEVLFVGNQALKDDIQSSLEGLVNLHFAPNIRPALELERLNAAQAQVAKIYTLIRARQVSGVGELNSWARGGLLPTATAFGRVVRFWSKAYMSKKGVGVLGVDAGAAATTIAAAYDGELALSVYPQFSLGDNLSEIFDHIPLKGITRWLTAEVSNNQVRDYIINKSIYPSTLPTTEEEMAIEQAIARQVLQSAVMMAAKNFPEKVNSSGDGLLPWFEPIVATGSVLTESPSRAQSALIMLDGLQPTGVTTLVLDQNHIASALGAAAGVNSVLAVQVLNSNSFLYLGTVISPVGRARPGTPVLRLKMTYESGHETSLEVKQGSLEALPLPYGQTARLQLQPLHRYDIGMGAPGRGGSLRVMGGSLGVIIDARGRPLSLPSDHSKYRELSEIWLQTLGGR